MVMLCLAFGAFFITSTMIISAVSGGMLEAAEAAKRITQGLSSDANADPFSGLSVLGSITVWAFIAAAVSRRYGSSRPSIQVMLFVAGILIVTVSANMWLRALVLEAAAWNPEIEFGNGTGAAA